VQNPESSESDTGRRWQAIALLAGVVALVAVPPSLFERLPSVCLNRHIFGFCPACGSLRALVNLFHGNLAGAVRFNHNVLLTGPVLVMLLLSSLRRALAGQR
jgi:hypothetical protein